MKVNHSGTIRIAANYARLFSTCLIGLFVVRMLLRFGDEAYGLIALLGTGTGLALVLKDVVRASTVPVLGEAFHSEEPKWFEQVYNSALLCSVGAGVVNFLIFGIFALCLPFLNFPSELYVAALVFVCASGIQSFFTVIIAPLFNFYVVSERMVAYNALLFLERLGDIVAVAITLGLVSIVGKEPTYAEMSSAVITYGVLVASFSILVNVLAAVLIIREDRRLFPSFRLVTRKAIKAFLESAGWNSCVIVAMNLYARVDMVIMNVFFGLFGNMVFSLANQAVAYMRQLIMGLVAGMDAVASRVSNKDGDQGVVKLMHRSTSLQAMVVFPTMLILLMFAEPLAKTWLHGRLDNPDETIPAICWLMRILVFGIGARCLSEGWMWIMNGAGKVRKYAPVVLIGGILNPILACLALYLFPESYRFAAPALVFSTLLTLVHLVAIPSVVAREYELKFFDVIGPLAKPAMTAVVCLAFAYGLTFKVDGSIIGAISMGLTFGLFYAVAAYLFLLTQEDRNRLSGVLGRFSGASNRGLNR
jgi:O-antigen/teichoic acid export membrane protein